MQEDWNPNYKRDPKLFKRLVQTEAKIEQDMREYFLGLSQRVSSLLNWNEIYRRQTMAENVVVTINDDAWQQEQDFLVSILSPSIGEATLVGGLMAESDTGVTVGIGAGTSNLMKAVRQHSLELAKQLNQTTQKEVREAVLQGLDAGEKTSQIVERLSGVIDNPRRAELIARTEAVRSNTIGKLAVAPDIGAQFKIWEDGQAGECPICLGVSPKRVLVDDTFSIGVDGPPGHQNCRCGMSLDFATPEEAAAIADGSYQPDEGDTNE